MFFLPAGNTTKETEMDAKIALKYNRTSLHIDGLQIRTAQGSGNHDTYWAQNACGSLTRSTNFATARNTYSNPKDALEAARNTARAIGRKLCKNCEKAAIAMIDALEAEAAETEAPAAPSFSILVLKADDTTEVLQIKAVTRFAARAIARQRADVVSAVFTTA